MPRPQTRPQEGVHERQSAGGGTPNLGMRNRGDDDLQRALLASQQTAQLEEQYRGQNLAAQQNFGGGDLDDANL